MLDRTHLLNNWIKKLFPSDSFKIIPASKDASYRSYYRLFIKNETYIIMDAPPVYINLSSFIDITKRLKECKVNVPKIFELNLKQGFLLLSDFGNELYLNNLNQGNADKLYENAILNIINIQFHADTKNIPLYDSSKLYSEMNLFIDWLLKKYLELDISHEKDYLDEVFHILAVNALDQPQKFTHLDYHSRNLMILPEQSLGVIDYQDAVKGPLTYDLISLLKDCYIKWSKQKIDAWVNFYLENLQEEKPNFCFDRKKFQRWFDLMGVQRHIKASGIFARLALKDNKHGFLKDIPRTLSYISDLEPNYKELRPLCLFINKTILPRLEKML